MTFGFGSYTIRKRWLRSLAIRFTRAPRPSGARCSLFLRRGAALHHLDENWDAALLLNDGGASFTGATSPRGSGGRMRPALSTPLNAQAVRHIPVSTDTEGNFPSRPVAESSPNYSRGSSRLALDWSWIPILEKKRRSEPNRKGESSRTEERGRRASSAMGLLDLMLLMPMKRHQRGQQRRRRQAQAQARGKHSPLD